jgi:DNA-binding PadR family transcriptional regulator
VVKREADPTALLPLSAAVLHTLLALAEGARHGYAIAQDVETLTDGQVRMGPGTLYGTLQRCQSAGLIDDAPAPRGRDADDERRRYYRLTPLGRRVLELEIARLDRTLAAARAKRVLRRPEPA